MKGYRRLKNIDCGAVFETKDGIKAVKSEYYYSNENPQPMCILLASGEFAHFINKGMEWVREIPVT